MEDWAEETGLSRKEQEGARRRLKTVGLLAEARRGVPAKLYYQVDLFTLARRLNGIPTHAARAPQPDPPDCPKGANKFARNGQSRLPKRDKLDCPKGATKFAPNGQTTPYNTETTTEITSKTTTTPNPSSSNERAAEPETARGGGGVQDQNPKDPDGNHGIGALESSEEKTVFSEEAINGQRLELTFPAKLTEREQEDITAQVYPLPTEVAQQMLDVIQARIQSGPPIRTNPAAVLRGIIRKYQADPANFDPSSGFQIAEARRRRTEAEARLRAALEPRRAALEPRNPVPATLPLSPSENRPKGRPEGLKRLLEAVSPRLARAAE